MDGAARPPQGPEEETAAAAAATAPGPGPEGNKFADIRRLLAEGAFPPAFGSMKRKNLKRYAQKFVLEGGCLYYVGSKKALKREVVVDPERRRQVFLDSHFTESGHHLGQKKTAQRIQSRYYWLGVVKDVVDWIRGCQTCQHAEHTKNGVRKARPAKAEAPWEILGMELQGPFPETARANTHVLIVTDYFSKWIEAIPLQKKDALSVSKALASLFYRFGASRNIYSSQSWAFCEEVSRHLSEQWSISQTLTPSATPDPTGLDEATAELLKAALLSVVKEKQPHWDEHLEPVVFGFRTAVSPATKHTPFFLMFNRHVCLSSEADPAKDPKAEGAGSVKTKGHPPFPAAAPEQQGAVRKPVIDNAAVSGREERRGPKRKAGRVPALAFSVEDRGFLGSPLKKFKKSPFVSFQFETILPAEQPPAAEGKQSPSAEH